MCSFSFTLDFYLRQRIHHFQNYYRRREEGRFSITAFFNVAVSLLLYEWDLKHSSAQWKKTIIILIGFFFFSGTKNPGRIWSAFENCGGMRHLVHLLILVFLETAQTICPRGCNCTEGSRTDSVICDGVYLGDVSALLNPRIKVLSLRNCGITRLDPDVLQLYPGNRLTNLWVFSYHQLFFWVIYTFYLLFLYFFFAFLVLKTLISV